MSYAHAWNESTPTSATAANTIAAYWTDNMKATRERLDDIFGVSGTTSIATAYPFAASKFRMTATAVTRIIGGSTSFGLRNNADSADNAVTYDGGSQVLRTESGTIINGATTIDLSGPVIRNYLASGSVTLNLTNRTNCSMSVIQIYNNTVGAITVTAGTNMLLMSGASSTASFNIASGGFRTIVGYNFDSTQDSSLFYFLLP